MGFKCSETEKIISASDLAWKNRHCDVILTLLHVNLRYPEGIIVSECSDELKNFIASSEELHMAVINRNEIKIQEILNLNSGLSHFYDRLNISAPKLALDLKFIDIYELLLKNKIFLGHHETMSDLWTTFSDSERETLREIHFKYSINVPEKHLMSLSTNSSISHDDQQAGQKLEYIRYGFSILNNNPLIRIILMIVAASKIFNIIFDFNRQSVNIVDPTADSWTRGLFYITGRIYIGAAELLQRSTENEAFGTLAHELCHYAMNLVYENRAKPYLSNDKEAKEEFSRISKICKGNSHKDKIIQHVYESYPKRMQHAELIVRVPHLLAMYHDDPHKIAELRVNFGELFDFYEKRVVSDMEKALPIIEAENQIEKKARKILKYKIILVLVGIVSILGLIASVFIVRYIFYRPEYPFVGLSETEQDIVRNAPITYKDINIKFKDLFSETSMAYEQLKAEHITLMLGNSSLNFSNSNLEYLDVLVTHNWNNMTIKLKDKALSLNLTFQNESFSFKELNDTNPKLLSFLTSDQILYILNNQDLIIGKLITVSTKFYMDRKIFDEDIYPIFFGYKLNASGGNYNQFINSSIKTNVNFEDFYKNFKKQNSSIYASKINELKNNINYRKFEISDEMRNELLSYKDMQTDLEEIIENIQNNKIFILSSEVGAGKTAIFEHLSIKIKKRFPLRWVSYIDLKSQENLVNEIDNLMNITDILFNILGVNSDNEFEKQIFYDSFDKGYVVLLWDGFDEILHSQVLDIMTKIKESTKNVQFLSTNPLSVEKLKEKFRSQAYAIVPFNIDEQNKFIEKCMKLHDVKIGKTGNIKQIRKMIETLKVKAKDALQVQDFDTPLVFEMLAEVVSYQDVEFNSKNNYHIYQKYIDNKIKIWQKSENIKKIIGEFNVKYIFQKYALLKFTSSYKRAIESKIYLPKLKIMKQTIPKELKYEEISRMGILYINNKNDFEFSHQTLVDFFVAQYFIDNIYNTKDITREEADISLGFFYQSIIYYGHIHTSVVDFMNVYLKTENLNKEIPFNSVISEVTTSHYGHMFFILLSFGKSNALIFQFLFSFFQRDHDVLLNLLKVNENETLYTASFNMAYYFEKNEFKFSQLINELGLKTLKSHEHKKFLEGQNQKGIILYSDYLFQKYTFKSIVTDENYRVDSQILLSEDEFSNFEQIRKSLTKDELNQLFLSKYSPIYKFKKLLIIHEKFHIYLQTFLDNNVYKKFLTNVFEKFVSLQYNFIHSENDFPINFYIQKIETHLTNSEIQEIFFRKNILMTTSRRFSEDHFMFNIVWKLFLNHSNREQQRELLLKTEFDLCDQLQYNFFLEKCSPRFAQVNLLQLYLGYVDEFQSEHDLIVKIYEEYFSKTEMQKIISNSNNFLPFIVFNDESMISLLKYIFKGNEKALKIYLEKKIEGTNLNIFEYMVDVGLNKYANMKMLKELIEN